MLGKSFIIMLSYTSKKCLALMTAAIFIMILINTSLFTGISISPLSGRTLIIDPGHGGIDGGTNDGEAFLEKDINLQISIKLKELLEAGGANVKLTRYSDISLDDGNALSSSRHTRDLISRVTQFNSGAYDLFVSIHVNSSSNNSTSGSIVLYSSRLPKSALLADSIQKSLNMLAERTSGKHARHNTVKSDFYILKNTSIPGVIVETGFRSNYKEKKLLKEPAYQKELSKYIYEGISDYFKILGNKNNDNYPFNIISEVRLVLEI